MPRTESNHRIGNELYLGYSFWTSRQPSGTVQNVTATPDLRPAGARAETPPPEPDDLLKRLVRGQDCLTHIERVPARPGTRVDWPQWVPDSVVGAFVRRGVAQPWSHQSAAATLANDGLNVVVSTGTGSGKSLAYQLPVLAALTESAKPTALYISPTKALAADQLRGLIELELPGIRPATLDGDTPYEEREWVRNHGRFRHDQP